MPHLPEDRKKLLREFPKAANCEGDFNFLYTVAYLQHWLKEGNQRYAQIHKIRLASMQPATIEEVKKVEDILTIQNVPIMDRIVARDLAFKEFERLVVGPYEAYCIRKNGIVEEYNTAIRELTHLDTLLTAQRFDPGLGGKPKIGC